MRTRNTLLAALAATLAISSVAGATGPRPQRPGMMVEAPPGYTYNASWVTGVSQDGGAKGQSIKLGDQSTDTTDFAYYAFAGWWDHKLTDVRKIRASFYQAGATNSGGSPRMSIELADSNYQPTGGVIYLDPAYCGALGTDGWVYSDFTGSLSTTCSIWDSNGTQYVGDGSQSAWSKLVSDPAYAGMRIWFAYFIQDATTGFNYIDRIYLDSAFFTKAP